MSEIITNMQVLPRILEISTFNQSPTKHMNGMLYCANLAARHNAEGKKTKASSRKERKGRKRSQKNKLQFQEISCRR